MKRQTGCCNPCQQRITVSNIWGGVIFLLLFCLSISSNYVSAQDFVKSYHYQNNLLHYTPLPVPNTDEYVMAGTMDNKFIHFIHTDGAGNVLDSKSYDEQYFQDAVNITLVFATRRPIGDDLGDDIFFTAPIWNNTNITEYLNIKGTRTDANGDLYACPQYVDCVPEFELTTILPSVYGSTIGLPAVVTTHPTIVVDGGCNVAGADPKVYDC